MAYVKKNLTPAQRSEIARKAAAARKTHGGGRPKGSTKDPSLSKAKVMRSIPVYEEDYKVFRRIADYIGKTMAETMHDIAVARVKSNPKIFSSQSEPKAEM